MKTILHILAIFLLPVLACGQETLVFRGQVTDALTNEPLADSHIYVSCQNHAAISDENGYFELEVPKCYMTQCLIVSYMGYDSYKVPIHNISNHQLTVELEPGVITLAELVITPDDYSINFKPEFEPFQAEYPSTFSVDAEINDGFLNDQEERLVTMF